MEERTEVTLSYVPPPTPTPAPIDLKIISEDRDNRSMLSWANSFKIDPFVGDIVDDMKDGLVLLRVLFFSDISEHQILDRISPKIVDWKRVNQNPDNTFKRTENCNYVVSICQQLGISMKGIVGKDIEEGNDKLTKGLENLRFCSLIGKACVWQLMRYDVFNFLKSLRSGGEITEEYIVDWANKRVHKSSFISDTRTG